MLGSCQICEKTANLTQYYHERICDHCIDELEQMKIDEENDRLEDEHRMREGIA